jgi:hypothetical protein
MIAVTLAYRLVLLRDFVDFYSVGAAHGCPDSEAMAPIQVEHGLTLS